MWCSNQLFLIKTFAIQEYINKWYDKNIVKPIVFVYLFHVYIYLLVITQQWILEWRFILWLINYLEICRIESVCENVHELLKSWVIEVIIL